MPESRDREILEELASPEGRRRLRDAIARWREFPTREALQASPAWRESGAWIERLLGTVQTGGSGAGGNELAAVADRAEGSDRGEGDDRREGRDRGGMRPRIWRIVHWNILKGIRLERIGDWLSEHPDLRGADAVLFNEVDVGMARSGNRHVAAELALRLGCCCTFVPSYLELTKGIGTDLDAPGENEIGLHGVAILTREPPAEARAIPLPEAFDAFAFHEKRYGRRTALLVRLREGLRLATVHLEVRGTPRGRARQMARLLEAIGASGEPRGEADDGSRQPGEAGAAARPAVGPEAGGSPADPILIGGDWNTHTFARGGLARSALGLARILGTRAATLDRQLLEPWRDGREPLFDHLRRAGYRWEDFNDRQPTARERIGRVEETALLGDRLRRRLLRIGGLEERELALRLDWFAGRGLRPAGPDAARAVGGMEGEGRWGDCPSDHLPLRLSVEVVDREAGWTGRQAIAAQ